MKTIGITGGIGTGKSTVSAYLREKGYDIIDADEISRETVAPGSPTLARLAEAFGRDIISEDGSLNRRELAKRAFSDSRRRDLLNTVMHGDIKTIIYERREGLRLADRDLIFIDAPLLFESGLEAICDAVWVVCADESVKINRVTARDRISAEEVRQRIACQMTDEQRLSSDVKTEKIQNNDGREELYGRVDALLELYV